MSTKTHTRQVPIANIRDNDGLIQIRKARWNPSADAAGCSPQILRNYTASAVESVRRLITNPNVKPEWIRQEYDRACASAAHEQLLIRSGTAETKNHYRYAQEWTIAHSLAATFPHICED